LPAHGPARPVATCGILRALVGIRPGSWPVRNCRRVGGRLCGWRPVAGGRTYSEKKESRDRETAAL